MVSEPLLGEIQYTPNDTLFDDNFERVCAILCPPPPSPHDSIDRPQSPSRTSHQEYFEMDDNTVGSDSSGSSSLDLDKFGPPPGSFLFKCDVHPASPTTVTDVPPDDDSVSDEYLLDDPFVASYDDLVYDRTLVLDDFG